MNGTVLCVVELENYPDDVAARAAWLAKLYDCELELTLSDPSMSFLGESFVFYADMQRLADTIKRRKI